MTQSRTVAVTGVGMVTPLGNDAKSTWEAILSGESGVREIAGFDASGFPTRIAAEVKNLRAEETIEDRKLLKYVTPFSLFALAAAEEAVRDAGVRPTKATAERWGLVSGSGMMTMEFDFLQRFQREFAVDGQIDLARLGAEGARFISSPEFARHRAVAGQALLHKRYDIRGYSANLQALGLAMRVVRSGQADFVLAGGYDTMINPIGLAGFCLLGAISTDNDRPSSASRPFDLTRNGFVLGEGAGFMILEDWQRARDRGAKIYAEIAGEGNSLSSYRITDSPPSGDGPIQAIRSALEDAEETIDSIDYLNAHGTSTPMNDLSETNAIKAVFGDRAYDLAVSSTKSQMGHLIAAAGAVEGIICALAIQHSTAPMTANLRTPDAACDLDYVSEGCRPMQVDAALSNSFGFGGSNSCLVFRSPQRAENRGR